MRGVEAFARLLEARAETEREARSHLIGALTLLAEKIERAAEARARGKLVDAARQFQQAVTDQAGEGFAEFGDMFIEFTAGLDNKLGGRGRSGGADIGDEIGDGEIGFVADAGDDGNFGGGDGARHEFFVEGPQIFHGAATAREDENVHESLLIEKFQGFDDFFGGAFALDAHGVENEMNILETAPKDTDDVADRGAFWGSDEADAAGQKRQRLLARRVE